MPPQIRAIIAVLTGIVLGYSIIFLFQVVSPFHPPEGIGLQNAIAYNEWVSQLPTSAYLYFLISYFISALAGGAITGYMVLRTPYQIGSLVTGFTLLILAIGSFLAFNHPVWMTYSACIGFLVFSWAGGYIVRRIFK